MRHRGKCARASHGPHAGPATPERKGRYPARLGAFGVLDQRRAELRTWASTSAGFAGLAGLVLGGLARRAGGPRRRRAPGLRRPRPRPARGVRLASSWLIPLILRSRAAPIGGFDSMTRERANFFPRSSSALQSGSATAMLAHRDGGDRGRLRDSWRRSAASSRTRTYGGCSSRTPLDDGLVGVLRRPARVHVRDDGAVAVGLVAGVAWASPPSPRPSRPCSAIATTARWSCSRRTSCGRRRWPSRPSPRSRTPAARGLRARRRGHGRLHRLPPGAGRAAALAGTHARRADRGERHVRDDPERLRVSSARRPAAC